MANVDVIVIGGGIAGMGCAAMLAAEAHVVVLERERAPGTHTTGRSAAIFLKNYGSAAIRAATAASERYLQAPPEAVSDAPILSPRGALLLAAEHETAAFERELSEAQGLERISTAEALNLVPILRAGAFASAAYEAAAQDIDVDRLFQGWTRQVKRAGGEVVVDAEAQRISRAGAVWTVETPAGLWQAPVLVNAAGAWGDVVGGRAGAPPLGLAPLRRSIAVLPAPRTLSVDRWPVFESVAHDWYAKPQAGKLLVSPSDEDLSEPCDAAPDEMTLAEGIDRYQQMVTAPVTRVEHRWAGLRSFLPDGVPAVGWDRNIESFFWLVGQGGYGIQTAPALSRLAAELIARRDGAASGLAHWAREALAPHRLRANEA